MSVLVKIQTNPHRSQTHPEAGFSDIGINRGNTSPAKRRSSQQNRFLISRGTARSRGFFPDGQAGSYCLQSALLQVLFERHAADSAKLPQISYFLQTPDPLQSNQKVRHGIGRKIISQIHRHHQRDRLFI